MTCKLNRCSSLFIVCILFFALFASFTTLAASKKPAEPLRLKVLTYNVWLLDLPFQLGSHDNSARLAVIPHELAKLDADIIALQEVWSESHKKTLKKDLQSMGYPHIYSEDIPASWLLRGWIGNGLLIASKYPLILSADPQDRILAFTDFTRPDEYLARKGALHVRVNIKNFGEVSFYNTHLGAVSFEPSRKAFNPTHESRRQKQAQELFQFVQRTKENRAVILAGDFNAHSHVFSGGQYTDRVAEDYHKFTCWTFDIISNQDCLNLQDSYAHVHSVKILHGLKMMKSNLYSGSAFFYKEPSPPQRIDYIFISVTDKIKIHHSEMVLTENLKIQHRAQDLPLSDHFGFLTIIELH